MATFRFVVPPRRRRQVSSLLLQVVTLLCLYTSCSWAFTTTRTTPLSRHKQDATTLTIVSTPKLHQSSRSYEQYYPRRLLVPLFAPSTTKRKQQTAIIRRKRTSSSSPNFVQQYAWLLPLSLCTIPLLTQVWFQAWPATPGWWRLVDFQRIYTTTTSATTTAIPFLASNASYLGSSLLLLRSSKSRAVAYWTLAAGCMSFLFHTAQVYAPYTIAEALCYWDHGLSLIHI